MNLANHLVRAGLAHTQRPAIAVGKNVHLRYGELAARSAMFAAALRKTLGLDSGDRVALITPNCAEYFEMLYGCWHAGLIAVPVNAKLHPHEFDYILKDSGTRAVFADTKSVESIADLNTRQPDDGAWLFYTSGTTGKPKGATLSHRNLLAAIFCYFADVDQGSPWAAMLHAAPLSHGAGLYGLAHTTQASCHVLPESGTFDPAEIFSLIEQWPSVSMFAAPTMAKRLIDHPGDVDSTNLKAIIYGGGPMYLDDLERGIARFGPRFAQLYGQGESPMTISASSRCRRQRSKS